MTRSTPQIRADALAIWQAGLNAVRADRLMHGAVEVRGRELAIGDECIDLDDVRRIVVVGAGKAGAGMAAALEETLGEEISAEKQLSGWVNVPADCVRPLKHIHLHPARPPGVNEPTQAGVDGSLEILRLVSSLSSDDLCIALISGGGSALMPLPLAELSLADKLAVTRFLSASGAPIEDLNAVRKQLSRIKGGNLARACRAGRFVSLIISDVLGDPLDVIASGPTVPDHSTPDDALRILDRSGALNAGVSQRVFDVLRERRGWQPPSIECQVTNLVIGNNALAVDAAGLEAERLGYSHAMLSARRAEGPAEDVGRHLTGMALAMRTAPGPDCLISGGEPTVKLVPQSERGLGGRNQQLVLAAAERMAVDGAEGILMLSAGTDGEDGPTDAAGAFVDADVIANAQRLNLDPSYYLNRNDAFHWFEPLGALIKTGSTNTNVCDLRVVLVDRVELSSNR